MKGKVGLHGHKLFIGISSFSTELFREGSFNFHIVIFFVDKRINADGGMGGEESGELGGSVTISTFSSIDLALFLQYILSYHDMWLSYHKVHISFYLFSHEIYDLPYACTAFF